MTQDLNGQVIGNYNIGDLLGAGGMGQVYQGTHTLLNRQAAIKVMHAHLAADPTFRSRFLQEAKAAAELDHHNIVQIYEFNEWEGQFYLVMELITGGSLRGVMGQQGKHRGDWSLRKGLDLIRQTAEGLSYAHSRSMVHRDIKPDNLLLKQVEHPRTSEPGHVVKISDFGLARLAESAILTASGVTMGTPAYMSPEQAQGHDIDGRSDLYSLGVVLYELATGYLPFETRTLSDAVHKHVYVSPKPPSEVNENVSPKLEDIILRCLEKDPDNRFEHAVELLEEIRLIEQQLSPNTQLPSSHIRVSHKQETQSQPLNIEPPDVVPQVSGESDTHRIQILGPSGEVFQTVSLPDEGLTIGRLQENDLTLTDKAVSRFHIRIDQDSERVEVTDLGSWNGSSLGGERLLPNVRQAWSHDKLLQVASYWLRLVPPTPARISVTDNQDIDTSFRRRPANARARIVLDQHELTITPGKQAMASGTIINLGNTVDHFTLSVEGIPHKWIQVKNQDIQLNPGNHASYSLLINVARNSTSRARHYRVKIHVKSHANPNDVDTTEAVWEVLPFAEHSMQLSPTRASGRTSARFVVEVVNQGNDDNEIALAGDDEEHSLRFHFQNRQVRVGPSETASIPLKVHANRNWVGRPKSHTFSVSTSSERSGTHTVTGQMEHKTTIPIVALAFIGLVLIGTGILLSLFLADQASTPSIEQFDIDPAEIVQGDQVTISWSVSEADGAITLELPNGSVVSDLPATGRTVDTPQQAGTYTLIATNSEGTQAENSQTINVQSRGEETPTIPTDLELRPAISELEVGSDTFELSLENPNERVMIQVSVFSLSVTDDLGNQYEFDRFAMDRGLQATVPSGEFVNIEYVLSSPIEEDAASVTFILSDLTAQIDGGPFRTPLSSIQWREEIQ